MQQPTKYFLYIRKSTDEEDRQVLSLEAQLDECKEFAKRESLEIAETFIEKKTAKVPSRDIFNNLLDKIDGGLPHPIGILAWAPDRLSRNSIDGGRLIYLLDTGKLAGLKFPTFAFENTPSGKFFLSIALSNQNTMWTICPRMFGEGIRPNCGEANGPDKNLWVMCMITDYEISYPSQKKRKLLKRFLKSL